MYVKSNHDWSFVSVSADDLNFLGDDEGKFSYSCLIIVQLTFSYFQLTSASYRSFLFNLRTLRA